MNTLIATLVVLGFLALLAYAFYDMRRPDKRHKSVGAAASGTIYDMLNEDKRKAVEIIVEGRAAARDPEHRDGNLPDLSRYKLGKPN